MCQGFTQGVAGAHVGTHRHCPQLVEMVELARRHGLTHLDQIGQLHHAVIATAHIDAVEILRVAAVHVLQLHQHVVLLTILLEARHLAAAEQAFQAAADGGHISAHGYGLFAVNRDLELRRVELQIAVQAFQPRIIAQLIEQLIDIALQLAVLHGRANHEVHRLVSRALPERWTVDREGAHPGNILQFGQQLITNFELAARAVRPVLQLHKGNALSHRRKASDDHVAIGFRDAVVGRFDLAGITPGVVDSGAVRAVEHTDNGAGVFGRRQLGFKP